MTITKASLFWALQRHHGVVCMLIGNTVYPSIIEMLYSGWTVISRCVTSAFKAIVFHYWSLWLFTFSDIKTIVGPSFIFGAANAAAGDKYGLECPRDFLDGGLFQRLPFVLLWIWLNLLPFAINNQKSRDAIEEDKINKPWRTLPSERMTPQQAERLMLALYPLALGCSLTTGGTRQSMGLVILGIWYNNLAGGDSNCVVRNIINAGGYVCFTSGAMEVALGVPLPLKRRLMEWFGVVAAIILTTVHLQDMYDQKGDMMRERRTVPLVIGDVPARWSIAIAMAFWGGACPWFWNGGIFVIAASAFVAGVIATRSLLLMTAREDQLTFKVWNAWMMLVFILPLVGK